MENKTSVLSNFGRYMAIAEYLIYSRDCECYWLDFTALALTQPTIFFVKTIKKIHEIVPQEGSILILRKVLCINIET